MSTKKCNRCAEELKITLFYGDKRSPDGFASVCRRCSFARRKELTGSNQIKQVQITENVPCDGCKWTDRCKKRHMSCKSYRQWVLNGRPNDLPRYPDSHNF